MIENVFVGVPIKINNIEQMNNIIETDYDLIDPLVGIIYNDQFITLKSHKIFEYIPNMINGQIEPEQFDKLKENTIYIIELINIDWKNMLDEEKIKTLKAAKNTFKWYNRYLEFQNKEKEKFKKYTNIVEFKPRSK